MIEAIAPQERYIAQFQGAPAGEGPAWLPPLRRAAISRFAELGFPTRHDEEWRFTSIGPIAETAFQPADGAHTLTAAAVADLLFDGAVPLVFVNGRYAPELSSPGALPKGLKAGSLADALQNDAQSLKPHLGRYAGFENQAFVALNTAFFADGPFVSIARNAIIEAPIHLVYVSTAENGPTVSYPRTLIAAGENSQATIVETYIGATDAVYFTNAVTEVVLEENAVVDHYKVNRESLAAYHIATLQVQLARSSNFSSHSITVGGAIVRNDVNAVLNAEGIECTLNGLYLANGKQLVDNHTAIDHAMPHCNSHEVYKGILDDQARGVFNGKIFVRQDAQKTDAKQTNKTLLLSEDAQINTKPQLEIFADDVKCTHGATVGQLDANQIFYLRSRGIPEEEARALLIYAFAGDIVSRIKVEPVRAQLNELLLAHLPQK
jgi:Fe-S cluster assembly protein SufD